MLNTQQQQQNFTSLNLSYSPTTYNTLMSKMSNSELQLPPCGLNLNLSNAATDNEDRVHIEKFTLLKEERRQSTAPLNAAEAIDNQAAMRIGP